MDVNTDAGLVDLRHVHICNTNQSNSSWYRRCRTCADRAGGHDNVSHKNLCFDLRLAVTYGSQFSFTCNVKSQWGRSAAE
jgi:hypothetical protein